MAFMIHSIDGSGKTPGIEYLPASAVTPKIGMAMVPSNGKLNIATGATAPTYICMCEKDSPCEDGELIPVIRVQKDMIFETTLSVAASSLKLGQKVTLASDGLRVTATTTNGVAEIVYVDDTDAGSMCRVRF